MRKLIVHEFVTLDGILQVAGAVRPVELGVDEVVGSHALHVAHGERPLLDRAVDRAPDVEDRMAAAQERVEVLAGQERGQELADAARAGALGVIVVRLVDGDVGAVGGAALGGGRAVRVLEHERAGGAGDRAHQALDRRVVDRAQRLLVAEVADHAVAVIREDHALTVDGQGGRDRPRVVDDDLAPDARVEPGHAGRRLDVE